MNDRPYIPIDCQVYDLLEILSMHRTPLVLLPNDYDVSADLVITDLRTVDKVEYMVINDAIEIRLDDIEAVDERVVILNTDRDR